MWVFVKQCDGTTSGDVLMTLTDSAVQSTAGQQLRTLVHRARENAPRGSLPATPCLRNRLLTRHCYAAMSSSHTRTPSSMHRGSGSIVNKEVGIECPPLPSALPSHPSFPSFFPFRSFPFLFFPLFSPFLFPPLSFPILLSFFFSRPP